MPRKRKPSPNRGAPRGAAAYWAERAAAADERRREEAGRTAERHHRAKRRALSYEARSLDIHSWVNALLMRFCRAIEGREAALLADPERMERELWVELQRAAEQAHEAGRREIRASSGVSVTFDENGDRHFLAVDSDAPSATAAGWERCEFEPGRWDYGENWSLVRLDGWGDNPHELRFYAQDGAKTDCEGARYHGVLLPVGLETSSLKRIIAGWFREHGAHPDSLPVFQKGAARARAERTK
jgi:hypothetical protein